MVNEIPTRCQLKALVNSGQWHKLGKIFHFEPVLTFTERGKPVIDWRSVPPALYHILWNKDEEKHNPFRSLDPKPVRTKLPSLREHLYAVQSGICHYCHRHIPFGNWSIDHKLPTSRGGSNKPENKVGACKSCNNRKGALTELEFMAAEQVRLEQGGAKYSVAPYGERN